MLSLDQRFLREERIAWRIIEDEAVLIDRDEGEVLRLNPIGTEIWKAIDGERTVADIVDLIHQTFEVDRSKAHKDVLKFLKKLRHRELVQEPIGQATR